MGWEIFGTDHLKMTPDERKQNRFKDADNVSELIRQLVGAGSTCWVGGTGDAVFDATEAQAVAEDAIDRLIELGWA